MSKNLESVIKLSSLFSSFTDSSLNELMLDSSVTIKEYSKDEIIFFQGAPCEHLSIVLEGTVEIQQNDINGNTLVVSSLNPSNMFGENLLFGNKNTYPMDVVSKEYSKVIHLNKKKVTSLLENNHEFMLSFINLLSNKAILLSNKLRQVSMKSLRNMLCDFLLSESKKQNSSKIILPTTKQALADSFGVQRPSLSRELIKMKSEGLIDYDRKTITIIDFDGLY